jgi:CheY-like chemotaxis protein
VVELQLLLPAGQLTTLEAMAARSQLTVGALLRRTIGDFLRSPMAARAGAPGDAADQPVCSRSCTEEVTSTAERNAIEPNRGLHSSSAASARPWGVLVVDDNEAVRATLEIGLRASGFAVWLTPGGRAGVAAYLKHRPAIDVVLLDVRMPDWDGPETLAAIRALDPGVPCCFMSGDTGCYTAEDLLGLGAVAVFQKPFGLGELITQLRRLAVPGTAS